MSKPSPDAFVIGAGVCGLSSALAMLKAGLSVTVYGADLPNRSTSAAAGALWGVHLVGEDERIGHWAAVTLDHFRELGTDPSSGVRETAGLHAFLGDQTEPPDMTDGLPGPARADEATLPAGYRTGWRYRAPVISMPVYLDYLVGQVIASGGTLQLGQPLHSLTQARDLTAAPVIVNCTGIGARELVPDDVLMPVRGQVVVVPNPGLTEFFVGERAEPERITYLFPHGATVVLGGTEQPGNSSTAPDHAAAGEILAACTAVEPRLKGLPVLAHRVGLRPLRPQVRLEISPLDDGRHVVHNYGHGGAGVTLSWGCARAVSAAAMRLLG
jgi:D-amino-acid oxidase